MTDEMESMEQPHSTVQVRPYIPTDHAAIVALAPRFLVGLAPWLDEATFLTVAQGWIASSIAGIGPDQAVFVAEQQPGQPRGFVAVTRRTHFTGQERAYVGELAVAPEVLGTGMGRALLAAAEAWATAHGLPAIELDTGAANVHARGFYAHVGYGEESIRLVKRLAES